MKITKTILSLSISLLFLTNCSKEEISFQTDEETNITESLSVNEPESTEDKNQESKSNTDEQNHSNEANRTEHGNNPTAPELPEVPSSSTSSTFRILVEYYGDVTNSDKQITRNTYGTSIGIISYEELDNDSDLWVVNEELYNFSPPIPTCCPKVKSTEAEDDEISQANWDILIYTASTTINL